MSNADIQYRNLATRVLEKGDDRMDRTGTGARSVFGEMVRFDLSTGEMPILTTKRVYWKTAIKEMLWFLTGRTNIQELLQNNVRIWTDWPLAAYRRAVDPDISQEAFEEKILSDDVFAGKWGDLGPVYGKQWRRWLDADGREHDQIATLVDQLRHNPGSRRMLFDGWNVGELDKMALPPCHMVYQYFVNGRTQELSCLLFQRSCDIFAGLPFNWTSAATLVHMLAQQADLKPGELIWVGGDVHLYANHHDQMREQLSRVPRAAPTMRLSRRPASIDDYCIDDFVVEGYDPHPSIKADIAV
ncbi:MAG: thymidylate synthase [Sphingomonadaceae bacterium]